MECFCTFPWFLWGSAWWNGTITVSPMWFMPFHPITYSWTWTLWSWNRRTFMGFSCIGRCGSSVYLPSKLNSWLIAGYWHNLEIHSCNRATLMVMLWTCNCCTWFLLCIVIWVISTQKERRTSRMLKTVTLTSLQDGWTLPTVLGSISKSPGMVLIRWSGCREI